MFHEYPNPLQNPDIITGNNLNSFKDASVPIILHICWIPSSAEMFIYFENNGIQTNSAMKKIKI